MKSSEEEDDPVQNQGSAPGACRPGRPEGTSEESRPASSSRDPQSYGPRDPPDAASASTAEVWKVPYTDKDHDDTWEAYSTTNTQAIRGATAEVRELWRVLNGRQMPSRDRVFAWYRAKTAGFFHPSRPQWTPTLPSRSATAIPTLTWTCSAMSTTRRRATSVTTFGAGSRA